MADSELVYYGRGVKEGRNREKADLNICLHGCSSLNFPFYPGSRNIFKYFKFVVNDK